MEKEEASVLVCVNYILIGFQDLGVSVIGGEVMSFSQRLREVRKRKNISQIELGEILGISYMTVRRWEAGIRSPRMDELKRLADVLGVSEAELLNGGGEPEKIRLELIFDKMPEEVTIDMGKSAFNVFLGADGEIGIKGGAKFQSLDEIEKFFERAKEQARAAFEWQVERGAITPAGA